MFKRAKVCGTVIISALLISCKSNDLHSSKISGTIQGLSYSIGKQVSSKDYTTLKINNKEYKVTITSASGSEFSFIDVARIGDSIFKKANSDSLFVTRVGFKEDAPLPFPFIVKEHVYK